MSNDPEPLDQAVIATLRGMACHGQSPSKMVREVKRRPGPETHIVTLLSYFRHAFHLTLPEAKPLAALSRNEKRDVEDEPLLDELLAPAIRRHRSDWEGHGP